MRDRGRQTRNRTDSDYIQGLLNRPGLQVVGRDLAVTNTSAGSRKSVIQGGAVRATIIRKNFNWLTGSITDGWKVDYPTGVTATQVDSDIVRIQTGVIASEPNRKVWGSLTGTNGDYTFSIQVKSNVASDQSGYIAIVNDGSDVIKVQTNFTAGSDWQTVNVTGTTDGASAGVRFNIYGADNTDILYRFPSTVAFASETSIEFPQNSAAGYTKTDQVSIGGLPVIGVMAGATNLVDTDLTNWATDATDVTVSDQGSGIYRITLSNPAGSTRVRYAFTGATLDRSARCMARLVSGSFSSSATNKLTFSDSGAFVGDGFLLENLTTSWQEVDCSVASSSNSTDIRFRMDANETVVFEVKLMRAVDLSAPVPAFADGTGAGEVYAVDTPTATGTDIKTVVTAFYPYGYSGTCPSGEDGRVYQIQGKTIGVKIENSVGKFWTLSESLKSTYGPVDGDISVISHSLDGVTEIFRVNDEKLTGASSTTFASSETVSIGNDQPGNREINGVLVMLIFDRVLSDAEYEEYRSALTNYLSRSLQLT